MNLLEVKDLRVEFTTPDGIVTAVNDLNFALNQGKRWVLSVNPAQENPRPYSP